MTSPLVPVHGETSPRDGHDLGHGGLPPRPRRAVPFALVGVAVVIVALGTFMARRSSSKVNTVALSGKARPVTVIEPKQAKFRPSRTYVGTLQPWVSANIGPQIVNAYVDTVLVRPGAVVKRGDVLATLDCRNASATSQAVAMQARALESRQKALANEAQRIRGLLDGGFVSPNEAEQKEAVSASEQAELLASQAKLVGSSLEVNDCILRAPFAGEIATRTADPGSFVRPGSAIVSLVDRSTVRVTGDAPEVDFDVVAPGTEVVIHSLATRQDIHAPIARRAPAADPTTRTVHFELDIADPTKTIPVGTTGELHIDVGEETPAIVVPLSAAAVRGAKATLFFVQGDTAYQRVVPLLGEAGGQLYLTPNVLPSGARVVTEGRALLSDGDKVIAAVATASPSSSSAVKPPAEKAGGAAVREGGK